MERWATCPRCERPVRLTESELEDKRGFCARCEAQFEITGGVRDSPAPYRELARVPVTALAEDPRPAQVFDASRPGIRAITIEGRPLTRKEKAAYIAITLALATFPVLYLAWPGWVILVVSAVVLSAVGLVAARWARRSRGQDTIEIRDGTLWLTSRGLISGRPKSTPIGALRGLGIEEEDSTGAGGSTYLCLARDQRRPLAIGKNLGHDSKRMSWVARWLDEKLNWEKKD